MDTESKKSVRWISKEISYRSDPDKFFETLKETWPHVFQINSNTLTLMLAEGEARFNTTRRAAYQDEPSDLQCEIVMDARLDHEGYEMHSLIMDISLISDQEAIDLVIFMSTGASVIARSGLHHIEFTYDPIDREDLENYPMISIYEYLDDEPFDTD